MLAVHARNLWDGSLSNRPMLPKQNFLVILELFSTEPVDRQSDLQVLQKLSAYPNHTESQVESHINLELQTSSFLWMFGDFQPFPM